MIFNDADATRMKLNRHHLNRQDVYLLSLLFLLSLTPALASAEQKFGPYDATLVKVIDGDTLKLDVMIWPGLTQRINLRLNGVNTPESRSKKPCEKALAKKATEFTRRFVQRASLSISNVKNGKYAGRVLGSVTADGKDLVGALIESGNGRAYDGGKREGWC
jgi:endonuclease YncB( thermonuclease family)